MTDLILRPTQSVSRNFFKRLRDWSSPEGSLSAMLPPGLALPASVGKELLQSLLERERP